MLVLRTVVAWLGVASLLQCPAGLQQTSIALQQATVKVVLMGWKHQQLVQQQMLMQRMQG
jgi:hypothetical protein